MEMDIHIHWQGPLSVTDVRKLTNLRSDFGVYQIYAEHPVYGRCLVYIGLAARQTFGIRVPAGRWDSGSENDPNKIEIYVGRLKGFENPSDEAQMQQIRMAEALLIHSHGPAYNTQYGKESPKGVTHGDVRVLNWGAVRSLHREVSGLMWTDAGDNVWTYKTFERHNEVSIPPGDIEQ
jgi:hypothetical protein